MQLSIDGNILYNYVPSGQEKIQGLTSHNLVEAPHLQG